jgi:hypothetical protein
MKIDRERGVISFTLATLLFLLAPLAANSAENFAAHITKLDGKAFASRSGGSMRTLRVNDRLYARERVITGRKTSIDLKFTDGTALALGSSTIVTVDSYAYRAKSASQQSGQQEETFSMSILQGAVRAVTGLLAKRRPFSVRFKTKVATIGIRGTHFAAEVDGDSATIILLAQKDPTASNAIEVSNAFGKVEIDTAG